MHSGNSKCIIYTIFIYIYINYTLVFSLLICHLTIILYQTFFPHFYLFIFSLLYTLMLPSLHSFSFYIDSSLHFIYYKKLIFFLSFNPYFPYTKKLIIPHFLFFFYISFGRFLIFLLHLYFR